MSTSLRSHLLAVVLAALAALLLASTAPGGAYGQIVRGERWADTDGDAPEPKGLRAARKAVSAVGVPYRWGGESPESGFDCSGLVRWAYLHVGVELPHSSYALYELGRRVSASRLEPGDLLFFEGLGHVGLYLGRGRMVHAPQTGRHVEVVRLGGSGYGGRLIGARRVAA